MTKAKTSPARARYTLEFKREAVRLVESGQSIAAVALTLGAVPQSLFNGVKAQRQGKLTAVDSKPVSAEQMEISRPRAELARATMERDVYDHRPNESAWQLPGQYMQRDVVWLTESGATAWAATSKQASSQGRSDGLADLVQQQADALNARACQPDAVRAKLACRSTQASQFMISAAEYGIQGQDH